MDPGHAGAQFYLGLAQSENKAYAEAAASLQKAVALDDNNATYHFNLGVVYEKLGDFEASVAQMQRTIDLDPKHASALNYLGYMYAERGIRLDESIEIIQRALVHRARQRLFYR